MSVTTKGPTLAASALLVLAILACQGRPSGAEEVPPAEPASVTVYPVFLAGRHSPEVARVVAVMLERGGLERIELAPAAFEPEADASFDRQSQAFAAFAAKQPLKTDYALYGAYLGSPSKGVDEVRGVLVDAQGKVAWSDRQRPGDADFDRVKPECPMTCTVLLVERLKRPLHLADPLRPDAPKGQLAERLERESGRPEKAERAAMRQRLAALRARAPDATVVVYPVRAGDEFCRASATALAGRINEEKLLSARTAGEELRFAFTRSMNQQQVLWSGARSLQALVRQRPADADYVLCAHYLTTGPDKPAVGVHLFVLDRKGEFVIVDFQNSHHEDYRKIKPSSREDCTRLALVRLAGYLG